MGGKLFFPYYPKETQDILKFTLIDYLFFCIRNILKNKLTDQVVVKKVKDFLYNLPKEVLKSKDFILIKNTWSEVYDITSNNLELLYKTQLGAKTFEPTIMNNVYSIFQHSTDHLIRDLDEAHKTDVNID